MKRRGPNSPNRQLTRRDLRRAEAALAEIGETLVDVRDSGLWAAEHSSFDEYLRRGFAPVCPPAWRLSEERAVEFARRAIEAAERRRERNASRAG